MKRSFRSFRSRLVVVFLGLFAVIQIFGPFVTQLVARRELRRLGEVLQTATRWTFLAAAPVLLSEFARRRRRDAVRAQGRGRRCG